MIFRDQGATFSPDGRYRYLWWREIAPGLFDPPDAPVDTALWVMHNPSTADEDEEDPTTRRAIEFGRTWGCMRTVVVNRYAFCATEPDELRLAVQRGIDIVGPANYATMDEQIKLIPRYIVAAWGAGVSLGWERGPGGEYARHRGQSGVEPPLDTQLGQLWASGMIQALRLNADGTPAHPLYVPYDAAPKQPRHVIDLQAEADEERRR